MLETKKITRSAVLVAVGIVLPMLFHNLGISGRVFLPMHLPPLIGGFIVGPLYGAAVGVVLPLINFALSGMPAMPTAAFMAVELGSFGLITGLLDYKLDIFPSLIIAMLAGRIVYQLLYVLLIEFSNPLVLVAGGIATGLPGIVGQLILVPLIVWAVREKMGS